MSTQYKSRNAPPKLKTSTNKSGFSDTQFETSVLKPETSARGSKTLVPRSSALWVDLNERGHTTFSLCDVEKITGLPGSSARTW